MKSCAYTRIFKYIQNIKECVLLTVCLYVLQLVRNRNLLLEGKLLQRLVLEHPGVRVVLQTARVLLDLLQVVPFLESNIFKFKLAIQLEPQQLLLGFTCVFSVSSSSFCSMRLMRQLAAYPRFFSVRRRCFIRTISSRVRPRSFSVRLRSRTEIEMSSSSLMSGIGHGDKGACDDAKQ